VDETKTRYGDLLTTSEVSAITRKPVGTLRYYRNKGIGPKSGRLGGRIVYRLSDVERWIESQLAATAKSGDAEAS
jgi:DNA-binding transcriptional MerR regulator